MSDRTMARRRSSGPRIGMILGAGADRQGHTRRGFTALHFAAREGDLESTRLLLAAGVDVNVRSEADLSEERRGRREGAGGGGVAGGSSEESAGSTPLL